MIDLLKQYGLWGLFLAGFLSGSILPFNSEAVLTGLILAGLNAFSCILVATAGNALGGMSLFYLGYLGKVEWIEKYGKVKEEKLHAVLPKLKRWGPLAALLSFVPVIGDVLILALGFFRISPRLTLLFMIVGKAFRYWLLAKTISLVF
ncbi:MAG: DedA family protein [Marinilabiliales bacterium]|nr:DedA family protein [Marinilabiliales bacterium]